MDIVIKENALADSVPLPVDGLSAATQETIRAYSDGYQCSRDFVTASVFTAVSAAIGKRVRTDDGRYRNYLSLFLCLVAPSGSNKTTPMREILRPLIIRNASNYELFKEAMRKYDKEVKAGKENADKPVFRQLIISDTTPESRNKALAENGNILMFSDEIATMLYNVNRYNRSGELPQLMSIWSGDDVSINRKSELPVLIKEPCLSIIGGTQPDVLADTFGSDYFMSSGFNQRWLFVYPDYTPPAMYSGSNVAKAVSDDWGQFVNGLLDYDFESAGLGTVRIDGEAKRLYAGYYDSLQIKKAEACPYMAAVYSKLQIIAERWAGIAHFLCDNSATAEISPEEMDYSIRCMAYFERCAEKVYNKLAERRGQPGAKPLTKEQVIAMCYNSYEPKNKQAFADAIGVSRPFVSRAVKKYPLLRCYGTETNAGNGICSEVHP